MGKLTDVWGYYRQFTGRAFSPVDTGRRGRFWCYTAVALYFGLASTLLMMLIKVWYYRTGVSTMASFAAMAVVAPVVVYQGIKLWVIKAPTMTITRSSQRSKLSWKIIVVVGVILSVYFLGELMAYYPGAMGLDSIQQWNQVVASDFNNWHPALHTMMIWVVYQIVPNYSFFLGFQMVVFSFVFGYAVASLVAWGFRRGWVGLFILVAIGAHSTGRILLHPWKDTTFMILMVWLAVLMLNIVFTQGAWFGRWYNATAVAIVVALLSTVRHNGIFLTVPFVIVLVIFYRGASRNVLLSILGAVLIWLGFTQGLYRLADVERTQSQTYVEVVGLPMVMMGEVMVSNPEALDPDTRDFLLSITTEERWQELYETGNFNYVKWQNNANGAIAEVPPGDLASMTLRTIRHAPEESITALAALTRVVWSPFDWQYSVGFWIGDYAKDVTYTDAQVEAMKPITKPVGFVYKIVHGVIGGVLPDRIMSSIGLHMLILLMLGIYSLGRGIGFKTLFVMVPILAYNIGTMLLLCGPDYRYFQFTVVISVLLVFAMLARPVGDLSPGDDKEA
jgi:hypothetical protein